MSVIGLCVHVCVVIIFFDYRVLPRLSGCFSTLVWRVLGPLWPIGASTELIVSGFCGTRKVHVGVYLYRHVHGVYMYIY